MSYKYLLNECDIDPAHFSSAESFRALREKWIGWLENTIWPEIHHLMMNDAYFRCVNEMRKLAAESPSDQVGFNVPVANLLDMGYVAYQMMTIRRLCDNKSDVISLRRILKEISSKLDVITREIYVCYDGLPYDYETVYQTHVDSLPRDENGFFFRSIPNEGPLAWCTSERLHSHFDRLSGATPATRKRSDKIQRKTIDQLASALDSLKDTVALANNYIAHNGDPSCRRDMREWNLTFGKIQEAQKIVCETAVIIDNRLLYNSSHAGIIPTPQFAHFKSLDKGWITAENMKKLYKFWDEHTDIVDGWTKVEWPLAVQ